MLNLHLTTRFKRDLKQAAKRGKDIAKIETIIGLLQTGQPLPAKNRDHSLSGDWSHHRECHIDPDWLLIYSTDEEYLHLARTGTHADLFE